MDILILKAVGGVGLFLLGMVMLTAGLRALAGTALRRTLRRWTRSPASGAVAGALTTAAIQSSSATTVATVGLVGASLITFPQALGVVFGANIGTTITGWLVVLIGFKLQLGTVLTPAVLLGVLLNLFAHGRWKHVGWVIAGFSLLFIGIGAMQEGMAFLEGVVSPESFPADTLLGRLQLVLIGIAITLVTQSSSAGVATALAALGVGAISFPQAAALVIGMDVGTTVTAALATVGGSTASRRTGYSHVIYNVLTGAMAFFLLTPLTWLIRDWAGITDAQIGLVAFHTLFNALGVVLVIGVVARFAALVERLVPEHGPMLTARLDDRLLADPAAAADASAATVRDVAFAAFTVLADLLTARANGAALGRLEDVREAAEVTRRFTEQVRTEPGRPVAHLRHMAVVHALDHLFRLYHRCRQNERIEAIAFDPTLSRFAAELEAELRAALQNSDIGLGRKPAGSAAQAPARASPRIPRRDHQPSRNRRHRAGRGRPTARQREVAAPRRLPRVADRASPADCRKRSAPCSARPRAGD